MSYDNPYVEFHTGQKMPIIGIGTWTSKPEEIQLAIKLQRILDICKIKPANIQVELHAYFQQHNLVDYCHKNGITVVAYAPLGSPGMPAFMEKVRGTKVETLHLLSDPVVVEVAKKHHKQPAHVLLRYLMQMGIVVIPKSINPDRIVSNFKVFDFKLDQSDMNSLRKINKDHRIFTMNFIKGIENHPEYGGYQ